MSRLFELDTAELPTPAAPLDKVPQQAAAAPAQVDVWGESHAGNVRPNNEDHFLIARFGRFLESVQTNLPTGEVPLRAEESGYGMVVADGMGGRAAGELASQLAVAALVKLVLTTPDWIMRTDDHPLSQEVMHRARERFEQLNEMLAQEAQAAPALHGLGTTLTMAYGIGKDLIVAHVGDSRAYLFRQHTLHQLTHDHTVAQALADQGRIDQREVAKHCMRHVLTNVLGGAGDRIAVDVQKLELQDGDIVLLCTDGLTDMVSEALLAEVLGSGQTADKLSRLLIEQALQFGGKDNVTAIVARYHFPLPP